MLPSHIVSLSSFSCPLSTKQDSPSQIPSLSLLIIQYCIHSLDQQSLWLFITISTSRFRSRLVTLPQRPRISGALKSRSFAAAISLLIVYRIAFAMNAEKTFAKDDSADDSSEFREFENDSEDIGDIKINQFRGSVEEHSSLEPLDLRTGETALDHYQRTTCGPCRRGKYICSGKDQSRCSACLLGNTRMKCTFRRSCCRCLVVDSKTQCDGQSPSCSECMSRFLDCEYLDQPDVDRERSSNMNNDGLKGVTSDLCQCRNPFLVDDPATDKDITDAQLLKLYRHARRYYPFENRR